MKIDKFITFAINLLKWNRLMFSAKRYFTKHYSLIQVIILKIKVDQGLSPEAHHKTEARFESSFI